MYPPNKKPGRKDRLTGVPTPLLLGELERRLYCKTKPERHLLLMGKPGSGKGTVAKEIEEKYCLCHISIGDLLRAEQAGNTLLGKRVAHQVERGQLVADDTALYLLRREASKPECTKGFVLDGMPRSVCQAKQLDSFLQHSGITIDRVIDLEVDDATAKRRLENLLVHPPSGRIYNLETRPPKVPFTDDVTGEPLVRRADDVEGLVRRTEEDEWGTIERRLKIYEEETGPVIDYYKRRGKVAVVDAEEQPEVVFKRVEEVISDKNEPKKGEGEKI